jgi:protein arginine kinase activator
MEKGRSRMYLSVTSEEARVFADESPDQNLDFTGTDPCQECGEAPAVIHLLRVDEGHVSHARLCEKCAESLAGHVQDSAWVFAVPSSFQRFGARTIEAEDIGETVLNSATPEGCSACGTTLSDLRETGMVGCSECYQVFSDYLRDEIFGETADCAAHLGKSPRHGSEADKMHREVIRLQHMLRELVDCERFEEAASVRDRLTELGETMQSEKS